MFKPTPYALSNPFYQFEAVKNPIFDALEDVISDLLKPNQTKFLDISKDKARYPKTDVYEDNDGYMVFRMAVPGLTKEDLSIELDGRRLIVSGNEKREESSVKRYFLLKELKNSSFVREWTFADNIIDVKGNKKILSKLTDGILEVKVPLLSNEVPAKDTKLKIDID